MTDGVVDADMAGTGARGFYNIYKDRPAQALVFVRVREEVLVSHATIKQTAIYADLVSEHLAASVECLATATEKPTATKTATGTCDIRLNA